MRRCGVETLVVRATLASAFVFFAGCGSVHRESPQTILRAYAHALEEGRSLDAYRMLSEDARRGLSFEAYVRRIHEEPEEAREIARSLMRPTSLPVVTATVTNASGQPLLLVLEDGAWRIESSAVDFYPQDTPRHALESFVRAMQHKRYDVALRFAPDAQAQAKDGILDAEKLKTAWEGIEKNDIDAVLAAIKQALPTATIEQTGARASMVHRAGTVQLVREHGRWKIEDFSG